MMRSLLATMVSDSSSTSSVLSATAEIKCKGTPAYVPICASTNKATAVSLKGVIVK